MKNPCSKLPENRAVSGLLAVGKLALLLTCLYFFICSLSFLSDSFRILGGKNIGGLFSQSDILTNPIVGVMIGLLLTVLVQSSSTSTSIIVGLVAAGAAPVGTAIPMIMGSNIGTSVTNTIVSFTQVSNREEFRRAFAAATVHDMFNWLTVIVLLIVELASGFLEYITGAMVTAIGLNNDVQNPDFLKALTDPFTKSIIQLNKKVLTGWAQNDPSFENASTILKTHCKDLESREELPICPYLFAYLGPEGQNLSDVYPGVILLIVSLGMLSGCLIGMVKILNLLLGDKLKSVISRTINTDIPIRGLGWLTGYLVMVVGAVITILVQSSSVFTSTLTPLAGSGLVSLERVYPLTLGSNIGTTTTSILASMAAGGEHIGEALQIALVHLWFNVTGILLFYPIPFMRWPIHLARKLGDITSRYRWFALFYLIFMFFVMPLIVFGLSLAGPVALYLVLVPVGAIILLVTLLSLLQAYKPQLLPDWLRTWSFLPAPLRSLELYDRIITRVFFCSSCCRNVKDLGIDDNESGKQAKNGHIAKESEGHFSLSRTLAVENSRNGVGSDLEMAAIKDSTKRREEGLDNPAFVH